MSFRIELATPDDDDGIRRLLASNPVPGDPPVIYAREPNYFLGCAAIGDFCQVVIARHLPTGEIAGVGCRAVRTLFVNREPRRVGYLGQLRVDPRFRGRWLPHQGYRFLRELHADGRCGGYITTIVAGNSAAERLLVAAARPSLPRYRPLDRLIALTLPVAASSGNGVPAAALSASAAQDFLATYGPRRQFFPLYHGEDVEFIETGNAVGALWDQSAYKQTIVPGQGPLRMAYASFVCVRDDDAGAFDRLLDRLLGLAAQRGLEYVVVGLSARDPLIDVARRRPHLAYESRLYTVCMPGEEEFHEQLDNRIPYVELATL
jgi:hypothetical protein